MLRIATERLELVAFTPEAIDALLTGDDGAFARVVGGHLPVPGSIPPMLEDVLPLFRARALGDEAERGWWGWVAIHRESGLVIGSVGLAGRPDPLGQVQIGYAVYPHAEGRGYATEAARALMEWAFSHPGVDAVRATIPPWHAASIRIAQKLGMLHVGKTQDDEMGEVLLFERRAPSRSGMRASGIASGRAE